MVGALHPGGHVSAWHAIVRPWPPRRLRPLAEDAAWDERELVRACPAR